MTVRAGIFKTAVAIFKIAVAILKVPARTVIRGYAVAATFSVPVHGEKSVRTRIYRPGYLTDIKRNIRCFAG